MAFSSPASRTVLHSAFCSPHKPTNRETNRLTTPWRVRIRPKQTPKHKHCRSIHGAILLDQVFLGAPALACKLCCSLCIIRRLSVTFRVPDDGCPLPASWSLVIYPLETLEQLFSRCTLDISAAVEILHQSRRPTAGTITAFPTRFDPYLRHGRNTKVQKIELCLCEAEEISRTTTTANLGN